MKRTEHNQMVITYDLSPSEHETAIKEYVESHKTEDGEDGFIPAPDMHGVLGVEFHLHGDGTALVSVTYSSSKANPATPTERREVCQRCEQEYCVPGCSGP